jgi:hypothetical protein
LRKLIIRANEKTESNLITMKIVVVALQGLYSPMASGFKHRPMPPSPWLRRAKGADDPPKRKRPVRRIGQGALKRNKVFEIIPETE